MIKMKEIAWLGGLLEGEGYFGLAHRRYPIVKLEMTDEDTVVKVATIWNTRIYRHKNAWVTQVNGAYAIQWMLTLYPFLNKNRKGIIVKAVKFWRENSRFLIPTCHPNKKVHVSGLCRSCYDIRRREKKKLLEVA